MREIKFRAWDNDEKQMGNVMGFYLHKDGWVDIEILEEREDSDMKDEEYDDVEWRARMKNCTLMQYTGLKDKNGKEIYEGDIATVPNMNYDPSEGDAPNLSKKVVYEIGAFKIVDLDDDSCEEIYEYWEKEDTLVDFEIIGNIYENKELLN